MFSVRNKTIIGLKSMYQTRHFRYPWAVRNKTIIGLKYFCKRILSRHSRRLEIRL